MQLELLKRMVTRRRRMKKSVMLSVGKVQRMSALFPRARLLFKDVYAGAGARAANR